jgi:hypothetical protein
MHDAKEYFLVTGDELKQVKDAQRPFLNYNQLYDSVAKEEEVKIPITRWKIFNWRLT